MSSIAFLTYDGFANLASDEHIAVFELQKHGVRVPRVWNKTDADQLVQYDLVSISTMAR